MNTLFATPAVAAQKFQIKLKNDSGASLPDVAVVVTGLHYASRAQDEIERAKASTVPINFLSPGDRGVDPKTKRHLASAEEAFPLTFRGDATWKVMSVAATRMDVSCDYRLELWNGLPETKAVLTPSPEGIEQNFLVEVLLRTLGVAEQAGRWQLVSCHDDQPIGQGKYRGGKNLIQLHDDLSGVLAEHAAKSTAERAVSRKLGADIAAWRVVGQSTTPGSTLVGTTPAIEGNFASPIRANGDRAEWEKVLMAGALADALLEGSIKSILGDKKGLAGKLSDKASSAIGNAAAQQITSAIPADHYFESVCDLVAWMDASYSHRADHKKLMGFVALAYNEAGTGYHRCLMEKAAERQAAGTLPPADACTSQPSTCDAALVGAASLKVAATPTTEPAKDVSAYDVPVADAPADSPAPTAEDDAPADSSVPTEDDPKLGPNSPSRGPDGLGGSETRHRSILFDPFVALRPQLNLRFEQKVKQHQGAYHVGVVSGSGDSILISLPVFSYNLIGAFGGYNFYFKSFQKGWHGGPNLGIFNETVEFSVSDSTLKAENSFLLIGSTLGWKRIGDSGFTFAAQLGVGYRSYLAGSSNCENCSDYSLAENGPQLMTGIQIGYSF